MLIVCGNKATLVVLSTIVTAIQWTGRHFVYVAVIFSVICSLVGLGSVLVIAFVLLISQQINL